MFDPPDDVMTDHPRTPPTEGEIVVHGSPDELVARDHFLHRTVEEAEQLFRENSAYYQEDLMWMGPRAFAFYLPAAIRYLKSEHAAEDDHVISCLYEIIAFRSSEDEFSLALDGVIELVGYVIANYGKFDVDRDVYGDLLQQYKELKSRLSPEERP